MRGDDAREGLTLRKEKTQLGKEGEKDVEQDIVFRTWQGAFERPCSQSGKITVLKYSKKKERGIYER
jgi:hypothetical protein